MWSKVLCFLVLIGGSFCLPSANQYVDTVIHTTLQNVIRNEKLDPTHLSDFTQNYKDKTFLGNVNGKADYTEGSLSGLSQVARLEDCQGPTNTSSATVINCTLSLNYMKTSYKGKVKYGVLPKVSVEATADVTSTVVSIGISQGFRDNQAKLGGLSIRQYGFVNPEFSGLGPLNKHMKVLEEFYKNQVGMEVNNVVANRFQYALNLAVQQVPMPRR